MLGFVKRDDLGPLCVGDCHVSIVPTLADAVAHVVGMSAEKQVIWPNAPLDVAVVTDEQTFSNRTGRQFVAQSMSQCPSSFRNGYSEPSVTCAVRAASPEPTGGCLAYS